MLLWGKKWNIGAHKNNEQLLTDYQVGGRDHALDDKLV
jgi:hypothetical protein